MRNAFIEALTGLAEKDPRLMLVTADLGFGLFDEFSKRFPSQFLNVGVAEQNMIGVSTGLALEGRTVFAYSIVNFGNLRCLEQIRNDVCHHGANVKIVVSGAGFSYGPLGLSHHGTEDLCVMRSLQNLTLVSPADAFESREATLALARQAGPGYLRLDRSGADLAESRSTFELGKARVLREGHDLTLIATGGIASEALRAAELLAGSGFRCRVLSMHTLQPIDREAILSAAWETGGIVTLEEHLLDGGLGSIVAEVCMDEGAVPQRFLRIGLRKPFEPPVGAQAEVRAYFGLDASIAVRLRALLQGGRKERKGQKARK